MILEMPVKEIFNSQAKPPEEKVLYFGYGANRNPDMMKAIIGRRPKGTAVFLRGFELCVQNWNEIPAHIRKRLSPAWSDSFKTYFIRPNYKYKSKVKGIIWDITRKERHLIDNWEYTGDWYKVFIMELKDTEQLEIQVIPETNMGTAINGCIYKSFLNPPAKMFRVADRVRRNYINNLER